MGVCFTETRKSRALKRKATVDLPTETIVEVLEAVPSEEKTGMEIDSGYAIDADSPVDQLFVEKPPSKKPKRSAVRGDSKTPPPIELETGNTDTKDERVSETEPFNRR